MKLAFKHSLAWKALFWVKAKNYNPSSPEASLLLVPNSPFQPINFLYLISFIIFRLGNPYCRRWNEEMLGTLRVLQVLVSIPFIHSTNIYWTPTMCLSRYQEYKLSRLEQHTLSLFTKLSITSPLKDISYSLEPGLGHLTCFGQWNGICVTSGQEL